MKKPSVLVALSGGIDSSICAYLLQKAGYDVKGAMLKIWHSDENAFEESATYARELCQQLRIPFDVIDVEDKFKVCIVDKFIRESHAGITPNPCIECNRDIKWGVLFDELTKRGVDFLATGHYARLSIENDEVSLRKGLDPSKDQSYVLSVLPAEQLRRTILPLGSMLKSEVKSIGREIGLRSIERSESQDLCFMDGMAYEEFVSGFSQETNIPGDLVDVEGNVIGVHRGLAFYTIGQRKGLGLAAGHPLYVIRKDIQKNQVIVGAAESLGRKAFKIGRINILGDLYKLNNDLNVKIRYRATPVECLLKRLNENMFEIELKSPLRDITPGQQAVVYAGDRVILSGRILAD